MFESRISAEPTEKLPAWDKLHAQNFSVVLRQKDTLENAWNGIANWQTKRLNNKTKFLIRVWTITKSERKNWNACTWHEMVDLTFCGQSINWHDLSQNGLKACDRRLARLNSYIHFTIDYRKYCHVGNAAQHCRLGFQDSDFAGDLEDSKSTSVGVFVHFLEVEQLYRSAGCEEANVSVAQLC